MIKNIDLNDKRILISRTDSIGDLVLTLPICIWIKNRFPSCELIFLGKTYTKAVLNCLSIIDEIMCWDEIQLLSNNEQVELLRSKKIDVFLHIFPKKEIAKLAKKANIKLRIGTSHRIFHLLTCNVRINFSRKNSNLHEAQLNFKLCQSFGLEKIPSLEEISESIEKSFKVSPEVLPKEIESLQNAIILHPKSQGSAIEWPIEKYLNLAQKLLEKNEIVVFSGTEKEGLLFRNEIPNHPNCIDLTGKLNLAQFIYFISQNKALVACSTGPYHLAGILGLKAIGLFSSKKPIHPGRWKALGKNVLALEYNPNCESCKNQKHCSCMTKISVEHVFREL